MKTDKESEHRLTLGYFENEILGFNDDNLENIKSEKEWQFRQDEDHRQAIAREDLIHRQTDNKTRGDFRIYRTISIAFLTRFIMIWTTVSLFFVFFTGIKKIPLVNFNFYLSDALLIALLVSALSNILSAFFIILKSIFHPEMDLNKKDRT